MKSDFITDSKRLMGAVLVGPTSSRNSSMLLRQSPVKRDDIPMPSRCSKVTNDSSKNCSLSSAIPVDTEALRELKRRVLVCLDNNATAEQVARSLVNDCPDWSSKLKKVSDVISNCNNNNGTSGRKRLLDGSSVNYPDSCNSNSRSVSTASPRRRLSTSHVDGNIKGTSLQKQQGRSVDDISPIEVVTECFDLLDHLISDIAQKDDEIARLQRLLDAAEQTSHACERRLEYMKHYCQTNGIVLSEMPTSSINVKTEPDCNDQQSVWVGSVLYWKDVNSPEQPQQQHPTAKTQDNSETAAHKSAASDKSSSRSPRKCRRSSVELLTLPSIHNPPSASATSSSADVCRSQSSDGVMDKVRKRRASAMDPDSSVPSKKSRVKPESESEEDTSTWSSKSRARKAIKMAGTARPLLSSDDQLEASGPAYSSWAGVEEAAADGVLPSCLTTAVPYCYTDFEVMLTRRDKEAEAVAAHQASVKRIDTPGWRIAPMRGRTRAATQAAAQAALAAVSEQTEWAEPGEMPKEGSSFEEWAALADEPFEARHLRHEQVEKRREKAELRAYREYQRHARLREAMEGGPGASCPAVANSAAGAGGAGASDGATVDGGATNGVRLPESLWPDASSMVDFRDCRIYYHEPDCIPVVAFGRLVPSRQKKSHGFSLPWTRRSR